MKNGDRKQHLALATAVAFFASMLLGQPTPASGAEYEFHDSHFHLTNYVQEGIDVRDYLEIMGDRVGRSTLFGIPLQQMWSYQNTGNYAPTYYLHSDAPLYYYSFTDAHIAQAYKSLTEEEQARFDPMITGFNPADMYAVDHIRRVLATFPGVFSGIGEFTIHKEFVSAKVAGEPASLTNPALDRIFELAAEVGLVVLFHCDVDIPFHQEVELPRYMSELNELAERHPGTTIIWAHIGLGRVVFPPDMAGASAAGAQRSPGFLKTLARDLDKPGTQHVHYDISWDELAKYIVQTPESIETMAKLINAHPDRFLFGTDVVAPRDKDHYFGIYHTYQPLWDGLTSEARQLVLKGNYERLFDAAAQRVRAWEASQIHESEQ